MLRGSVRRCRLAVRQARVRFSARHPEEASLAERRSDEDTRRRASENGEGRKNVRLSKHLITASAKRVLLFLSNYLNSLDPVPFVECVLKEPPVILESFWPENHRVPWIECKDRRPTHPISCPLFRSETAGAH